MRKSQKAIGYNDIHSFYWVMLIYSESLSNAIGKIHGKGKQSYNASHWATALGDGQRKTTLGARPNGKISVTPTPQSSNSSNHSSINSTMMVLFRRPASPTVSSKCSIKSLPIDLSSKSTPSFPSIGDAFNHS